MLRRISWEWWLLASVLGLRLVSMALLPLTDTTEARYGEIARLMAVSGNWITPWFSPGVPFWGKPPLSFWCEALSFNLFGVNEFAARLPSWLVTLATLVPIYALAQACYDERVARRALLVFSTCALAYVLSGAVLTDPFLVLGTTLSMSAFALAPRQPSSIWRYGFFAGLAIGLLAKGPVALVLTGGALLPWLLWHRRDAGTFLRALPWIRGSLLVAVLTLPWYIAAEIRTPGFLYYFIIGEHFLRFLDPGWNGDLYGTAHIHTYGTIWWYWLVTAAPWSILGLGWLIMYLSRRDGRRRLAAVLAEPKVTYLLAWSLFTLLFFSLAANILWTYVLPALPAFSILLAACLDRHWSNRITHAWRTPVLAAIIIPALGLAITVMTLAQPHRLKTAKALVHYVQQHAQPGDRLIYLQDRPFSARFYSRETAGYVSLARLPELLPSNDGTRLLLAVPEDMLDAAEAHLGTPINALFRNRRYVLVTPAQQPAATASSIMSSATTPTGIDNG